MTIQIKRCKEKDKSYRFFKRVVCSQSIRQQVPSSSQGSSQNLKCSYSLLCRAPHVPECTSLFQPHSKPPCIEGLVFHTDHSFVNCLKANDMIQSMSRKGNCIDNSKMETFFGHIKREMYYGRKLATRQELYNAIDNYK